MLTSESTARAIVVAAGAEVARHCTPVDDSLCWDCSVTEDVCRRGSKDYREAYRVLRYRY